MAEARWLEAHGCDAIIAQGLEAGGHRGMFLDEDTSAQVGTMALVPQVVDAVRVPVIAAGGIGDGRGIAAALMLGAQAAQLGTAFLRCPESGVPPAHRAALATARDDGTRVSRLFTGRPARALANRLIDTCRDAETDAAPYPAQLSLITPLRQKAGPESGDFLSMWVGQAAALARELPAAELVRELAEAAAARLGRT